MGNPVVILTFLDDVYGTEASSSKYKKAFALAHECLSVLQLICDIQNRTPIPQPLPHPPGIVLQSPSIITQPPEPLPILAPVYTEPPLLTVLSADEISKLENLLSRGIITKNEHNAAKKDRSVYISIITGKSVKLWCCVFVFHPLKASFVPYFRFST
jgi:hypothetical protein